MGLSPLSAICIQRGVGIRFINVKRDCLRCSHLHCRPSISGCRPADRSAPRDTINTSISVSYNARKGPARPSGSLSRISDTIGSYLALPRCSMVRCLSNRPSLNLLRAPAEKRLTAHLHLLLLSTIYLFFFSLARISRSIIPLCDTCRHNGGTVMSRKITSSHFGPI